MSVQTDVSPALSAHAEREARKSRRTSARRIAALIAFVAVQWVALTFLQKIGFPVAGAVIHLALPVFYAGLAILVFFVLPRLDLMRLLLFAVFAGAATTSALGQTGPWSVNSLLVSMAIYLPMLIRFDVDERVYRVFLGMFLNLMVLFGIIEIVQMLVQLAYGPLAFPSMDKLAPPDILVPGYHYLQPINYAVGTELQKPNAFFFLEVSFLAQFLAIAFAVEMVYFRRVWRMAFYAACLLISFSGTGLLLLAVCGPLLLTRVSPRAMIGLLIVTIVAYVVAVNVGWYDQVHDRFFEFTQARTSGNHRFVEPLVAMINYTSREPNFLFQGIGPGNIYSGVDQVPWPVTKVSIEYGYVVGLLFYVFLTYSMFKTAPHRRLAFMFLVWYSFMGTFATPIHAFTCILFTTLFRIAPTKAAAEVAVRSRDQRRFAPPLARPSAS